MRLVRRFWFFGLALLPLLTLTACNGDDGLDLETNYPSAGEDRFELTRATVEIEVTLPGVGALPFAGVQLETVELEGPMLVMRDDPQDADDDGLVEVPTEIIEMELRGTSSFGPLTVRQSPDRPSLGEVEQQEPGQDFPADSFFDVFVEIVIEDVNLVLHNEDPLRMEAELNDLPPAEDDQYLDAMGRPLPIYTESGIRIGQMVDGLHIPNPPPPPPPPPDGETPEATPTEEPEPTPTTEPTPTPMGGGPADATLGLDCDHRIPGQESDVIVRVSGLRPGETASGFVEAALGEGVIGDGTFSATADDNGVAEARIPISQFGPYDVTVHTISGTDEFGDYDTPVNLSDSIEVEVCPQE